MIYRIVTTKSFEKDLKRLKKSGKNLNKLEKLVELIASGEKLPEKYRAHILSGGWANHWECHIEPDWLLIWRYEQDKVKLERSGTHSNLF